MLNILIPFFVFVINNYVELGHPIYHEGYVTVEPRLIYARKGVYRSAKDLMQVITACIRSEGRFYTVRKGFITVDFD